MAASHISIIRTNLLLALVRSILNRLDGLLAVMDTLLVLNGVKQRIRSRQRHIMPGIHEDLAWIRGFVAGSHILFIRTDLLLALVGSISNGVDEALTAVKILLVRISMSLEVALTPVKALLVRILIPPPMVALATVKILLILILISSLVVVLAALEVRLVRISVDLEVSNRGQYLPFHSIHIANCTRVY